MTNTIVLETISGGNKQPDSGRTVEAYNYHASDAAGFPPNGTKIDDCAEISTSGVYKIEMSESLRTTIVADSNCRAGLIGVLLDGDKALDGSVDNTALEDAAVTPAKTTFVADF